MTEESFTYRSRHPPRQEFQIQNPKLYLNFKNLNNLQECDAQVKDNRQQNAKGD